MAYFANAFFIMDFIILALATYRLSFLIAIEDGMYDVFDMFREFVGVKTNQNGDSYGKNEFAKMILCTYCNSIWVGVLLAVMHAFIPNFIYITMPFALSGFVVLIQES